MRSIYNSGELRGGGGYSIVGGEGVKSNQVSSMASVYDLGPIGAQYRAMHDLKSTYVSFKSLVGSMQLRWHGTLYFLASLVQGKITRGPLL